jgi:hypothetical protein
MLTHLSLSDIDVMSCGVIAYRESPGNLRVELGDMAALGERRPGAATSSLRQPLLGIGDLNTSSHVDAADDRVDGPDAYAAIDIPIDAVTKGGGTMAYMPAPTVSEPPSRLATLFPVDSLTDPHYCSPYSGCKTSSFLSSIYVST